MFELLKLTVQISTFLQLMASHIVLCLSTRSRLDIRKNSKDFSRFLSELDKWQRDGIFYKKIIKELHYVAGRR